MSQILYNDEPLEDVIYVLEFINDYTEALGIGPVVIDTAIVERVVKSCRSDFPHTDGIEKASAFKKVANFVCFFIAERPILEPFPSETFGKLSSVDNHQNAIIAFELARVALHKSTIQRKDATLVVENPIRVSQHSYIDIIDALSNVAPSAHFKLVTVLIEQLVYKTNCECQYAD